MITTLVYPGFTRDISRIKEQWQRMKMSSRQNIAHYKKLQRLTGGEAPPVELNEVDWELKGLLSHEFKEGTNNFYCDAIEVIYFKTTNSLQYNTISPGGAKESSMYTIGYFVIMYLFLFTDSNIYA